MKGGADKNAEVAEADEEMADTDRTLIEELLRNGVSLSRVCDLFSGRTDPKYVSEIARRVVTASSSSESGISASLPRLGTDVLERSVSATRDASFMKAHATNLTKEAPEELLDPLFSTLMKDPVVLSSGFVVDRDTALNQSGGLRFSLCPFTRAPLKRDVYPLIGMQRKLKDYRERTLKNMINTARRLLDERCFGDFEEVMSTAELFIDNLGETTYTRLSAQLATLSLEAYEVQDEFFGTREFQDKPSYLPEDFAKIYIRIYRGSPSLHDCSPSEKKVGNEPTELRSFQNRIDGMAIKSDEAISENRHDEAQDWLDACDMVRQACHSVNIPVPRLRLKLAKARGEGDLFAFHRSVYEDIKSDPEEVTRFCAEEMISLDDLTLNLSPLTLLVTKILDHQPGEEWRRALGPVVLEHKVSSIRVHAGDFSDQGWGNAKGNLGLALYDSDASLVSRCNLFGTCRSEGYSYGSHPARVLDTQDEIVHKALPGFHYALEYTVGGGGGHVLKASNFYCKVFPVGFRPDTKLLRSYTMHDPEDDAGLFTGNVDRNGKAHGKGELVYYDFCIFVGDFFGGSMKTGVLYKGEAAFCSMREGRWSSTLDRNMLIKFPLEASFSIGHIGSDRW